MNRFHAILLLLACGCARHVLDDLDPSYEPPRQRSSRMSEGARAWYLQASVAEARGDLDAAERALEWLVRLERSDPWAWIAVGRFFDRQGRDADAVVAFEQALTLDAGNVEAHTQLGRVLVQRGDDRGAEPHLRRAVEAGDDPQALHLLGRLYVRTEREPEAEILLERWASLDAASGEDALHRARLARRLERHDLAVVDLLHAIDHEVGLASAVDLLVDSARRGCRVGTVHEWAWRTELSERTGIGWDRAAVQVARFVRDPDLLESTLRGDPARLQDRELLEDRLELLRAAGRADEGLALLGELLPGAPSDPDLRRWEARLLVDRGLVEAAVAALERAEPTSAVLVDRVDLLLRLDRADEAVALTAAGLDDPGVLLARGRAVQAGGRKGEAEVLVREGADLAEQARRVASLRLARGDARGALDALLDVLVLEGDAAVLPQAAGVLPELAGDPRGEAVWSALRRESPDDPALWVAAARWSDAVRDEALEQALRIAPCYEDAHLEQLRSDGCPDPAVIERALEAAPASLPVLEAAEAAWERCGMPDEAREVLQRAARLQPTPERIDRLESALQAVGTPPGNAVMEVP